MPQPFNLTAEINLRGPSNLKLVVGKIRRELGSIKTDLDLKIRPESAKNIALVTSKLKALSKAAVDANADIGKLNTSLSSLAANFSSLSSSTSASVNGVNGVSASVKGAAKNIAATTTEIEEFGKQSGLAVRRFAAFSTVTGVVYGLVNAFSSAFSEFINFNKEIVRLSQVTGKSTDELSGIAKEITRLSTSLGVASSDLLTVSTTLAQAGLSANDTRVALEALAKSALAPSFDDLNETTEGSIAVLRQFGLQANELEGALGSINSVAAAFAVESADLITAIQRTGGVFASSSRGVSSGTEALNEFLAIFTSVRQTTRESAETIATGLRTIFTRIQRGQTIEFLKEYNIQLTDLEGKFVGPFEAVRRLSEGLKELDPRDVRFSQIVEELGGFRQIGKVIPLIQQFAVAQDALKVAQKGQGSLAEDARVAQQSLAIQFAKTREEFLSLVRELGDSSTFKSLATITLGLANGLISLTKALEPLLPLLVTFTAIKIGSGLTQYLSGFTKGFGGGGRGGAGTQPVIPTGPIPPGAPTAAGGASATNQINAITANTAALGSVVQPLTLLLQGINSLNTAITQTNALLSSRPPSRRFASGGFVPGSGNTDSVPAMLTPGEFVIRKSAVNAIGANRLSQINRYARGGMVSGSRKRRAYVFDFDDTLAESGAIVREGQPDPFIDFRGQKGADFIRSARATRYASMAKKRAAEGYDIHVLTARPGEKQTVSAIQEFMSRNVGSSARSVIGTGGFSGAMGGTASAKSMMLKKLSSLYEQIVFLDDDKENVLAAQQISGVKARLARKNSGGLIQKFALGGMVKDLKEGWDRRLGAAVLQYKDPPTQSGTGSINTKDLFQQVSAQDLLLKDNTPLFNTKTIAFTEIYQGLSEKANAIFQEVLDGQIVKSINDATTAISSRLRLPPASIDSGSSSKFLAGINKGTRGNLFEDILWNINNQSAALQRDKEDPDAPFDFPTFNPNLFSNIGYDSLPNKWVDAKASFIRATRDGGLTGKALNQIKKDIQIAISKGDLIPVFSARQNQLGKTNSTIRTSEIKSGNIQRLLKEGFITKASGSTGGGVYNVVQDIPQEFLQRTRGFNKGGSVAMSPQDTVPAMLTPGEFVINKKSAQSIGYSNLRRMNNVKGYNKGGIVGGVQTFQEGGFVNSANTLAIVSVFTSVLQPQIEKLADSFGKLDKETVSLSSGLSSAIREASSAISSTAIGLGALGASPAFRNQVIASTGLSGVAGGALSGIGNRGVEIALNENSKQLSKFDKILQELQQATDPEIRQRAAEELDKQFNQLSQTISKNDSLINFYDTLSTAGSSLLGWNSTIIAITTSSAALVGAIQAETLARTTNAASAGTAQIKSLADLLAPVGGAAAATGVATAISGVAKFGGLLLKFVPYIGYAIGAFQIAALAISAFSSSTKKTAEQTAELGKRLVETTKNSSEFTNANERFANVLIPAYEALRKKVNEQDLNKAIGSAITKKPLEAQIQAGTVSKFGDGFINELNPLFKKLVRSNLESVNIQLGFNQSIGDLLSGLKGIRLEAATRQINEAAKAFAEQQFILAGGTTGQMTQSQAQEDYNRLLGEGANGLEIINNVAEKFARSQIESIFQSSLATLASAKLTQAFATLENTISNVTAKLGAITTDFDIGIQKIDDSLNLLSAEPSATPNRAFSERAAILQNIQGFSRQRVEQALDETLQLITPENIQAPAQQDFSRNITELRSQVLSLQRVQQDVPTLLRRLEETQGRGGERDLITQNFEALFQDLQIDAKTRNEFINGLNRVLSETGGVGNKTLTLDKLIGDIPGLSKFFDLATKSQELVVSINEKYNAVTEKLADKTTELGRSFTNLNKLAVQQSKIRAETDINIRKVLGEEIKSAELNKLFDEEISQITGGIADSVDIGNRLTQLFSRAAQLREGGLVSKQDREEFAQTTSEITRLNSALDSIINSGTKLKNAFDNLEKKEKALFTGPRTLLRRLIENPLEVRNIQAQFGSLNRVLGGQGLFSDFQQALKAIDLINEQDPNRANALLTELIKKFGAQAIAQTGTPEQTIAIQSIVDSLTDPIQALQPEIKAVKTALGEQLTAIQVQADVEKKRQELLGKANDEYSKYVENVQSLFINEIAARNNLVNRLKEQEQILSKINRPQDTQRDVFSSTRQSLETLRRSKLTQTRLTAEFGDPVMVSKSISDFLPSENDIKNIDTVEEGLNAVNKALSALQNADRGWFGTNSEEIDRLIIGFKSLKQELQESPSAPVPPGIFFPSARPTTRELPQNPRSTTPNTPTTPWWKTGPSPLDTSSLDTSLDKFVGSFETSLISGLKPIDNIISGLNTVFSNLNTPIAAFTKSANDLLAGLEDFNNRGGIRGPNIPQEVSVSVTFDDTVTVVADRNGNKDLLSQIGILVSETVRRQLNEQNTFGDRRISTA